MRRQILDMAYLSASMPNNHKEPFSFPSYDDLLEQSTEYLDSDSYGLSGQSTDRSTADEWEKYFDLPDSSSGSDTIGKSLKLHEFDGRWDVMRDIAC